MSNNQQVFFDQYISKKAEVTKLPTIYRVLQKFEQHRLDAVDQLLPKQFQSILDIGCGDGHFLAKQQLRTSNIAGIDIVPGLIKQAASREWIIPKTFRTVEVGLARLPFKKNSFDVITAIATLQYAHNFEYAFSEIERVLKPRGVLIFEVPNYLVIWRRFELLFGKLPYTSLFTDGWDGGVVNHFSQGRLNQFIHTRRLSVESVTCSGILHQLRSLRPSLLGANLIYKCRKK